MSLAKDNAGVSAGPSRRTPYGDDFTAWAFEQAELLRRGELQEPICRTSPRRSRAWETSRSTRWNRSTRC